MASVAFKKRSRPSKPQGVKIQDSENPQEDIVVVKEDKSAVKQQLNRVATKDFKEQETLTATTIYESSREVMPQAYAGDATHTTEIDTSTDRDARAILERNLKLNEEGIVDAERNVYHGQGGYKNYIKKDAAQIGANKYTGTQGPMRAPSFVRSTSRFDYQQDICKDYKETGFCGFGDQCKFLHDRGDYKTGWELEQEWDAEQRKKKQRLEESLKGFGDAEGMAEEGGDDQYVIHSDDEDDLPFACYLCREPFVKPVVTLCNHYFCAKCIMDHSKTTLKCPACGKNTSGVYNVAKKLVKKLDKLNA